MKIWVEGKWYTISEHILIVQLTEKDRYNIRNMNPACDLYCEFDEKMFSIKEIKKLLRKLKKESP